jgi:hypothetical protein
MRRRWFDGNNGSFFITDPLPQDNGSDGSDNISIQNFALLFVKGQHQKRHNKTPSKRE